MPAKPKTIRAAETRVIKTEISTIKRALRKMDADTAKERKRLAGLHKSLDRHLAKIEKSHARETAAAKRRLAILAGRL